MENNRDRIKSSGDSFVVLAGGLIIINCKAGAVHPPVMHTPLGKVCALPLDQLETFS